MIQRVITAVFLALALWTCAGCSGSSSGNGATSTVTLKFGAAERQAAAKTVFATSTTAGASSAPLPSIVKKITITVTAQDITSISRTVTILPGQPAAVTLTIPNGTGRTFKVEAFDNYGNRPYAGSTSVDLAGGDLSVGVSMVEDINQAVTAKLYQYFKDTIEAKGSGLSASDLDPFYAQNFGINDGLGRTASIGKDLKDYQKGMLAKGMTSLSVSAIPLTSNPNQYSVFGRGVFTDKSYGFPDDGFIMVKENGEWKITGNGFMSEIEFRGLTGKWIDGSSERIESGLSIQVADMGNYGLVSAVVTGPGLPPGGIAFANDPKYPQRLKLGNAYYPSPQLPTMQFETYVMDDATLSTIPDNSVYTFVIYDSNNVVVEKRQFMLPRRPWLRAELTQAHFPGASVTPLTLASGGHYMADARVGSTLSYSVAAPTGFPATWLESNLDYFGWDTVGPRPFVFERGLLLTDTNSSFISTMPLIGLGGSLSVTASDFDNRREIRTTWLFSGPPMTTMSPNYITFGTTVTQDPTGIISPTATTVWKAGTAAPPIKWQGSPLLGASGVEIFLLADDPKRLQFPQASGDPFPGSMWVRLTTTPWPGSSGSYTLPVEVEKLGLVGSGCRVAVVSKWGDVWAISPPFVISP